MKENAYITFLSSDNYIYYILALNDSFKKTNSKYKLYCMITEDVHQETIDILNKIDLPYIQIDSTPFKKIAEEMKKRKMVGKYVNALAKLYIFNLTQFNKCVFLDSDLTILQNIDDLFDKPDWSAVEDCLPYHKRPQKYIIGESSFCSGMFVFSPNEQFYSKLLYQLPNLQEGIKWHDQAILAYNNQNWMQQTELHLPCEYDLLIAAQEDVLNKYLTLGGKQENIKVKHYVSHKDAPYDKKEAYYFWDNVYEEYYRYYIYINKIITDNKLDIELCHLENIYKLSEKNNHHIKDKLLIDLVVPYVDSTDPNWQKLFIQYNKDIDKTISGKERFRGQGDFFRFFFRGIEKNIPWINNIYLLVQSKSQVPKWLDQTNVKIITHDQFIPKEYLPTFNSCTIEMFLWNISGLVEKFIYLNDDFFITNYISADKLFFNNKCLFNLISRSITKNYSLYDYHCSNNYKLLFGETQNYLHLDHEIRPLYKSKIIECYNKYKKEIDKSISQFRTNKNYNIYLYSLYLIKNNLQANSLLKENYIDNKSSKENFKLLDTYNKPVLCINDTSEEENIYENKYLIWEFYQRFPNKSKYELYDMNKKPVKPEVEKSKSKADGQSNCYLYF